MAVAAFLSTGSTAAGAAAAAEVSAVAAEVDGTSTWLAIIEVTQKRANQATAIVTVVADKRDTR
jgi:hypothetical protein